MDNKFNDALEGFISKRINDLGSNESEALSKLAIEMRECEEKLTETLTPEQLKLWNKFETLLNLVDGETVYFYYKAGLKDTINFIFKMGGLPNG